MDLEKLLHIRQQNIYNLIDLMNEGLEKYLKETKYNKKIEGIQRVIRFISRLPNKSFKTMINSP